MFHQEPFFHRPSANCESWQFEAATAAVNDFVRFVRDSDVGNDLVDEIELPIPKPALVEAFKLVIVLEERTEIRALLLKAGLTLSQYHIGLGERIRVRPVASPCRKDPADPRFARKFNRALLSTAAERTRLTKVYQDALRRAAH